MPSYYGMVFGLELLTLCGGLTLAGCWVAPKRLCYSRPQLAGRENTTKGLVAKNTTHAFGEITPSYYCLVWNY